MTMLPEVEGALALGTACAVRRGLCSVTARKKIFSTHLQHI